MGLTVDAHIDVPWQLYKQGGYDLSKRQDNHERKVDFLRMSQGGLNAAFFALYLSDITQDRHAPTRVHEIIDEQIACLKAQKGCRVVDNSADAETTHADGLVPLFLGLEGGRLINADLTRLANLRKQGVRYLTLTHNYNTGWADSATDIKYHGGLTSVGLTILNKCDELDILIDVSHASDDTFYDVLTNRIGPPAIATHSGCRALVNHPRNLTDKQIKQIAAAGGIVCVPFASRFVGNRLEGVTQHIDHICQLVGDTKHVGIGSDLDGAVMVDGVKDVSNWTYVVQSTRWSDEQMDDIKGGNLLRIFA